MLSKCDLKPVLLYVVLYLRVASSKLYDYLEHLCRIFRSNLLLNVMFKQIHAFVMGTVLDNRYQTCI